MVRTGHKAVTPLEDSLALNGLSAVVVTDGLSSVEDLDTVLSFGFGIFLIGRAGF